MSLREIIFVTEDAMRFYQVQPLKVQRKIDFVFDLVRNIEVVPIQYFKFLKGTNGIFEIKVVAHLSSLRFLCFFNDQKLILVTNVFIKKSQKTPKKEIQIAERIKKNMKGTNFQPVPFEQILDEKYGKIGSPDRNNYEEESKAFRIGVFIKQARIAAGLTQEELALRIGTKKSYISRLERGLCDIQLNTLIRIIEKGLGRKFEISIL